MRALPVVGTLLLVVSLGAQTLEKRAWELESNGSTGAARELLRQTVDQSPNDPSSLGAWAGFLDRHSDPGTLAAYEKLLAALEKSGAPAEQRAVVARRMASLAMIDGDRAAAERYLSAYQSAGGRNLAIGKTAAPLAVAKVAIPGPLMSFARMSALAPDIRPDEVLTGLARNVVTNGYQASSGSEGLDQTEYLKLLIRYMSQARELQRLAPSGEIKIEQCESAQTAELLKVLGYRIRGACGSDVILETVNASRAFLTIDSGFPLAELEQALRTNRPFVYPYRPTEVPLLYDVDFWSSARDSKEKGEFIDAFLGDPALCRLYLGLSKLDPATSDELRKVMPVARMRAYAHVLDFFGGMLQIRDGKAIVPGGARAEKGWEMLVGVSPQQGPQFLDKLIARDDGWMASYFDALARIHGPTLEYLTDPDRLKRFYTALRGRVTSPGPARPVFRSNTELMLLTARLQVINGKPHVPGNIDVWRWLFIDHPHGKYDGKLTKAAGGWKDPDDVLEALFGLSRKAVENEPLRIFMAMSDIDRRRAKPLEPATVDRLARAYRNYGSQYSIFSESPALSDATIIAFLETAERISDVRDQATRADAAGLFQSLVSFWQIFVRQDSIPAAKADETLAAVMAPFKAAKSQRDLFDAGRDGVRKLMEAAGSTGTENIQGRMLGLLAGTSREFDARARMIQEMSRIFESQRLVSLQTIFDLDANLDRLAHGEKLNPALVKKLVSRIAEIQLPRSSMSGVEKNALAYGYFTEKHIDTQRKVRLDVAVEKAANDPEKLKDLRAQMLPFLRDTLVGLNYVHYAPPGAQILHTNPLFVRSHDFIGISGQPQTWRSTEVFGTGWPANAGGRLAGSLATLPYALAEAEQNFLIPSREQALIWGDLVPQMIQSAVIPRFWKASPATLHWIGMHMRLGESLVAESALNEDTRKAVMRSLDRYAAPARRSKVESLLVAGDVRGALDQILPSEQFLIAQDAVAAKATDSPIAADLQKLSGEMPEQASYVAVARFFGTPKPTLSNSFKPELLNLRTFPTLMGYSSRILAESWESNLLYFAALADELQIAPAELNLQIPSWTQQTVERIFATHLEDWPALLRSLRNVGNDVRQKSRSAAGVSAGVE
jgi:hypothetical protein